MEANYIKKEKYLTAMALHLLFGSFIGYIAGSHSVYKQPLDSYQIIIPSSTESLVTPEAGACSEKHGAVCD